MLSLDELTAMIEAKGKKSLNEERLLVLASVVRAEQALRAAECNREPSVYPACEARYKQAVVIAEDFDRDLAQDVMVSLRVAMTLYPDLMKATLYELLGLGEIVADVQQLGDAVALLEKKYQH